MPDNEYYLRTKLSRAIATKVAKRAYDFVTEEMITAQETAMAAQITLNDLVDDAVGRLLSEGNNSSRLDKWRVSQEDKIKY